MALLTFERIARTGTDHIGLEVQALIVAGWAGRDQASVDHHIRELAEIGVPGPSRVPLFYRVAAANLLQDDRLAVLGTASSGEVEPIVVAMADGLWVGVGSDHTDREAESAGIALSKQLCGKPVSRSLWRFEDVEAHWDDLVIRAYVTIGGARTLYQEGRLAELRPPRDLMDRAAPGGLASGTVMFGGTVSAIGGIRPAERFEMELEDPVLGRTIHHAYAVDCLPVVT